jgi:hypothetical protein
VMFVLIIGLVLLNTWLARRRRPATEETLS